MITADDLRDALILGIENAQREAQKDIDHARRLVRDGKVSPDDAHLQTVAATAVIGAMEEILATLTGDWPATR